MNRFSSFNSKSIVGAALLALAVSAALAGPAQAHRRDYHGYYGHPGVDIWIGGGWRHDWYGGRYGWWWVTGPDWYYYPAPVYPYPAYPYPDTGVTAVQPQAPS